MSYFEYASCTPPKDFQDWDSLVIAAGGLSGTGHSDGIKLYVPGVTQTALDSALSSYDFVAAENKRLQRIVDSKIERLWSAADRSVSSSISGAAIGLLTMGVMQAKPKALAVQTWIKSVWDLYYSRKAAVTAISELNTDFSSCGPMPCSVPELIAELGM